MDSINKPELTNKKEIKKGEKVVIIGDSFVGKTSIINCLVSGKMNETKPTIGAQHQKYSYKNEKNIEITLDLWDTAGQERFRSVIPMYYKGAKAILVVFDITNKDTFEGAKKWIDEIEQNNKGCLIFLVGNKIDLNSNRKVGEELINQLKNDKNILYYECSAKENLNVVEIFNTIGNKIPQNSEVNPNYKILNDQNCNVNQSNGFCC